MGISAPVMARAVAREESHQTPDILRLDDLRNGLVPPHVVVQPAVYIGGQFGHDLASLDAVHQTGADGVGAHAIGTILYRDTPRQAHHSRLDGSVQAKPGQGRLAVHGRDIDDGTGLLLLHVGKHELAAEPHAAQVNRHQPIKFFLGGFGDRTNQANPRAVH